MNIQRPIKLLFAVLLLLSFTKILAQAPANVDDVSDAQIEQFLQEAESRGLSESEIETLARTQGYSSLDIAKIRERIDRLNTLGRADSLGVMNATTRQQVGEVAERAYTQVEKEEKEEDELTIFGRSIFNNKELTFEPNLRLPTPVNYILGPSDEIKIDISGYAYQHYDVTVSPEGTITLESLSPIYVNGLSIEVAKQKIINRLKPLFGGLRDGRLTADVTLGNVRSIRVIIIGEVENPGSYTVSSMARVFNALYLSGGPTNIGSFREIKLIRENKEIASIDLYTFLMKGLQEGNLPLQDHDVIYIPFAQKMVEMTGELRREALFEMKGNETLKDAITFAGGFTDQAYHEQLKIDRNTNKEKKLITVDGDKTEDYALQNGDKIHVEAILDRYENKVEVNGAVYRPGEFALDENLVTVKDLIEKADGLREDAFLERVLLIRERDNLDPEVIALNLEELFAGREEDVRLRKNDQLLIKSIVELRELRTVEILGAVNQIGEYQFAEGMDVQDLILLAGGFSEGASTKRIEIAKRLFNDESSDETVEIYTFNGSKELNNTASILLSPFDKVFVRNLPNYKEQKLVSITGEVNYPGVYTISKREDRISDLLDRVGGLRLEAYLEGARFYRKGNLVALNLAKALVSENNLGNLILSEGDSLHIPKTAEVVSLSGQVLNPTVVAYQPHFSFKDYIAQAGGYTDSAFVKRTFVRYENGLTDRTRSFLWIKNYPEVERGMEVIVPEKHKVKMSSGEKIAIGTGLVSLSAVLLTLINLIGK